MSMQLQTEKSNHVAMVSAHLCQPHHEEVLRLLVVELGQVPQQPSQPGVVGPGPNHPHGEDGIPADIEVGQHHTMTSHNDTEVGQHHTMTSHNDTEVGQHHTMTSHNDTEVGQHHTMTSHNDTEVGRHHTMTSHNDTEVGRHHTMTSHNDITQ